MLTERLFDTGTVVLNIAEGATDGPPLLLLHGATANWQGFSEFIPTLEQSWHVYALDFRGHGKSGWVPSMYQIEDYVHDVVDLITHEIAQPVVVAGISLGGTITFGVAAQLARLVRAIIPLDPGLMFRDTPLSSVPDVYAWIQWVAETIQPTRALEDRVARCKVHDPTLDDAGAKEMAAALQRLDPTMVASLLIEQPLYPQLFEQIFPLVQCPTFMIRGNPALGGVVRDQDVTLMQTYIPHAQTVQVRDAGHGIVSEQAGVQTLAHMLRFLKTL